MPREQIHEIGKRRAYVIWAVALAVYVLAVFNRSSLGVAGIIASDRFGISATQLSAFTVLQLVVYAGLQIPVGVLLDRYGSKRLLLGGLVLMSVGQLAFAFVGNFAAALLARSVIGAGDALIFVSVLRITTAWFLVKQAPLMTQLTGQIGQLGAVAAAAPLSWVLHEMGWTRAFGSASAIGVLLLVLVFAFVKNSPYQSSGPVHIKLTALARSLRTVWGNPGTRLGLWSHFTSQFAATVFALLWGFPFLVQGQGLSSAAASSLLMVMTLGSLASGLALAKLVATWPFYRSWIVLSTVGFMATAWLAVLLWPGPAPLWLLVVMVFATATGGPAGLVGFDMARSFTPEHTIGRANGVVNIGGFVASLLTMGLIGWLLDLGAGAPNADGTPNYDLGDFKAAMSVQFLFWALGTSQILRYRRKAVAHLRREHPGAVEQLKSGQAWVHPGLPGADSV